MGQAAPRSCRSRGSLASLRGRRPGRRITGSGGWASRSVSRPRGRPPPGSKQSAGSPRPSSPRERHGSALGRGGNSISPQAGGRRRVLLAPAELRAVDPHPVQDGRELTGAATRARAMTPLGDPHAPGAQGRPLPAADQQGVRRLVQGRPGELVAAAADPALHVRPAGLVGVGACNHRRPCSQSRGVSCSHWMRLETPSCSH